MFITFGVAHEEVPPHMLLVIGYSSCVSCVPLNSVWRPAIDINGKVFGGPIVIGRGICTVGNSLGEYQSVHIKLVNNSMP